MLKKNYDFSCTLELKDRRSKCIVLWDSRQKETALINTLKSIDMYQYAGFEKIRKNSDVYP